MSARCAAGCCGGCGARPGISVQPCVAEVYPPRVCNVTRWYPGPGGRRRWKGRGRGGGDGGGYWDTSDLKSSDHDRRKRHDWKGYNELNFYHYERQNILMLRIYDRERNSLVVQIDQDQDRQMKQKTNTECSQ